MRDKYQALLKDRVELLGAIRHENVREVCYLDSTTPLLPSGTLTESNLSRTPSPASLTSANFPEPIFDRSFRNWDP